MFYNIEENLIYKLNKGPKLSIFKINYFLLNTYIKK